MYVQVCIVCRFMLTTRNKQKETFSWMKSCSLINSNVPSVSIFVDVLFPEGPLYIWNETILDRIFGVETLGL